MATEADVAAICGRVGVVLEELMPAGRPGGAVFVARVRDRSGALLMLKQTRPETGAQEILVTTSTHDRGALLDSYRSLARLAGLTRANTASRA